MVRVAPINLQYNPRTLWFDPGKLDIKKGDAVVVLTARGVEFGHAAGDVFEVEKSELKKLKSALKPVKRIASAKDIERASEMEQKSKEALPVFKEMAAEENNDMRPVSVEYLLEGDKAVFYFESEERVDFRELVRKLASHFHVRIDMRQIGVRDEARMVGGYGHCGQELCCARMSGGFCPVSIRMAKEQNLSLNPQKISGVCGRLMCCLRYEFDAYKDFNSRAPKRNSVVKTPEGDAKVVDLDVPREIVSLRVGEEKPVRVPLADLEKKNGSNTPNFCSKKAWEDAKLQNEFPLMQSATYATSLFTENDKLASAGSVRHVGTHAEGAQGTGGRAGSGRGANNAKSSSSGRNAGVTARKPRRRSTKLGDGHAGDMTLKLQDIDLDEIRNSVQDEQFDLSSQKKQGNQPSNSRNRQKKKSKSKQSGAQKQILQKKQMKQERREAEEEVRLQSNSRKANGPRPGQKSSGLRAHNNAQGGANSSQGGARNEAQGSQGGARGDARDGARNGAHDGARNNAQNNAKNSKKNAGAKNTKQQNKSSDNAAHRHARRRSHKANSDQQKRGTD